MNKICKFLTLIILIVAVLLFGIYQYRTFIQTEIYQENSEHLLATYEQVNRTFTLFTQRNWNVLSDWDEYLQYISDSENTETVWHDFADRKNNWQYSDHGSMGIHDLAAAGFLQFLEKSTGSLQFFFIRLFHSRSPYALYFFLIKGTAISGKRA